MQAKDIMTTKVIAVSPNTQAHEIARLLLENNISALPVVDNTGNVTGMVSEGDLTGRNVVQSAEKREWWLNLLAEGEAIAPEFLNELQNRSYLAHEIMSSPVICVSPSTDITEIARLLTEYHIKRVPVLEDNHIVGIVSRADLVRAILLQDKSAISVKTTRNPAANIFESLDRHFHTHLAHAEEKHTPKQPEEKVTAKDFHTLMNNFRHVNTKKEQDEQQHIASQHKKQVAELTSRHMDDSGWQSILHNARDAAGRGEKEYMLLRFPNELCTDGGRAINVAENGWQNTLRGEAAEIYTRWEQELKPQGFHISARVLEYPGGFPGDIGLFLMWGHVV